MASNAGKGDKSGRRGKSDSNYRKNYKLEEEFIPEWKKKLMKLKENNKNDKS